MTDKKKVTKVVGTQESTPQQDAEATKKEGSFEQLQDILQANLSGLNTEKAEALAKNIWLAGLGAYSRTFDELADKQEELQGRYNKINKEGSKIFDQLVQRGMSLQGDAEKAMQDRRESIEERVEELKERLGGGLSSFDIPSRLRDAAEKIEEISDKLKKKD